MHSVILLSYKVQWILENLGKRLDLEINMLSEMHQIQKEKNIYIFFHMFVYIFNFYMCA